MTVTYTVSYSEYLEARRLLRYTKLERYNAQLIAKWFIPALGVLLIALAIVQFQEHGRDLAGPFFGAAFGVALLLVPLWRRRRLRRSYEAQRMGQETRVSVDQDGLHVENIDQTASSVVKWEIFDQGLESRNVFMLLMSNAHILIISKGALDASQIDGLRDIFGHRIADFQQVK